MFTVHLVITYCKFMITEYI